MNTKYPAAIDDTISLPISTDNSSVVKGEVVNKLREAILAIEGAGGVNPGSVYGTIRARFEALETALDSIVDSGDILTISGDLSGTNNSQIVIGLRGNAVSANAPNDGYVLTWNESQQQWEPQEINIVNADINASADIDFSKMGGNSQTLKAQQFSSTVDSKGTIIDVQPKNIQTTDATPTLIDSFTLSSDTGVIITAIIAGIKSDNSQAAFYIRTAAFRNTSGTTSQIGTTTDGGTFEDDSTWDAGIDNSGNTIRIMATGKSSTTIRWVCVSSRLSVIV